MDIVLIIGRVLFAAIFVISGIAHFAQAEPMSQYAAAKGVPSAKAGVIASGVISLIGGVSILLGVYPDLGALLLIVFLIPVSVFMHAFWKESDPMVLQAEQASFFKNVALIGAALVFFYFYNQTQAVPSGIIDHPLFHAF